MEGSGRGLFVAVYRYLVVGTEGNHVRLQLGWLVSGPQFEPGISRMQTTSVIV